VTSLEPCTSLAARALLAALWLLRPPEKAFPGTERRVNMKLHHWEVPQKKVLQKKTSRKVKARSKHLY
jgi:hypothetical protein